MKNKKLRNEFIERLDTLSEDIHAHPLETRYDKFTMMKNTLIAEAKEAGILTVAKNMLNQNLDMKIIISVTGLTSEEIENLK